MLFKNFFSFLGFYILVFIAKTLATDIQRANFDYYSSFTHMKILQDLELELLDLFSKRNLNLGKREMNSNEVEVLDFLNEVNRIISSEKVKHSKSKVLTLLASPIDQYKLIYRMSTEWPNIIKKIEQIDARKADMAHKKVQVIGGLPASSDLEGSIDAITRLHSTYLLNTTEFASGNVRGSGSLNALSAEDCFRIGQKAYKINDFYTTAIWMREAFRKVKFENDKSANEFNILDHLAFSLSKFQLYESALAAGERMIDISEDKSTEHYEKPQVNDVERLKRNLEYYKQNIEDLTGVHPDDLPKNTEVDNKEKILDEWLCF